MWFRVSLAKGSKVKNLAISVVLITTIIICAFGTNAFAENSYDIIDLGGGSIARDINDSHQVVGSFYGLGSLVQPFLWEEALGMTDLDASNYQISEALGINNLSQTVGFYSASTSFRSALWENNTMVDIGNLGGFSSLATSINNNSIVAGYSTDASGIFHAFSWDSTNGLVVLGIDNESSAVDINDNDQIVGGFINDDGNYRAYVWEEGQALVQPGVFGGDESLASGINNLGQVVGRSTTGDTIGGEDVYHSYIWDDINGMTDLGTMSGMDSFGAFDINELGQIVGWGWQTVDGIAGDRDAFYWENGTMYNLNDFLPQDSGWHLQYATGINESGYIVGWGTINQSQHGFLMKPNSNVVPEPTTMALFGIGLLGAGIARKRRKR